MKGFSRLKNKKGIALESAIIFMVSIFTFCFLLSSLTLLGHSQAKINNIYIENNLECDQLGEHFISYVNAVTIQQCATPVIAFDEGTKQITITCASVGASIYYTTNGDNPEIKVEQLYIDPITNIDNCTIKAMAVCNGYLPSATVTGTVENGSVVLDTTTAETQSESEIPVPNATDGLYNYFLTNYSSYYPKPVATGFTIQHGGRVYTVIEQRTTVIPNAINFKFILKSGETTVMEISCVKTAVSLENQFVTIEGWKKY